MHEKARRLTAISDEDNRLYGDFFGVARDVGNIQCKTDNVRSQEELGHPKCS